MKRILQKLLERYFDLMTASPKIQLGDSLFKMAAFLQFILRIHFIFPKDGWGIWKYSDYKLNVPYVLLSFLFQDISDTVKILLILFNVIIFFLSFFKVKLIFYYNNLLWQVFYIPQVAMLAGLQGRISISLIGVIILFLILMFNLYFNRSTKFIHSNPFVRKFTLLTLLCTLFDTFCFIDFEFHLLQQVMLHLQGITLCFDIMIFKPYRCDLNKTIFQYAFLYNAIIILNTSLQYQRSEESMFYFSILYGTIAFALSHKIYDRYSQKDTNNQHVILDQCQEFYKSSDIDQYIKIRQHKNTCKSYHQNDNKVEIIICILETYINFCKKLKLDYEILELALIHFLCVQKAPLTALCRLKQYYNIPHDHSLFFKITFPSQHKQLWNQVTKVQEGINKIMKASSYSEESILTTRDIYEAVKIRDQSVPIILQTLDFKLNYWRQIISLIQNFKKLFNATYRLSKKIEECHNKICQLFGCQDIEQIEEPKTVVEVIILIIYYSIIINDYEQAIKMQKTMYDILRSETLVEGKLLNGNIMENKICLLYTSIVKSQGSIIKINAQQIAQFWGYENEMDFRDIKHINQLMPDFLAQVHDQYLERFKKLGHSILFGKSRTVFLKGKNNFFIPADITIDNFFISYDDYIITAAFSKTKEKCLFLLFDQKGRILGVNSLMFKLMQSIDRSITQDQISSGYIFQIIPKIFTIINAYKNNEDGETTREEKIILKLANPIRSQFAKLMQSSKGKNKHQIYYAGLWTTFDTPEQVQIRPKSLLNVDLFNQQKPDCELFDEGYQEKMQTYIDDAIQTRNFRINCYLEYLILGYYKSMPLFTLEINDIAFDDQDEETNSQTSLQNMELTDLNKSSHLILSSIQDESFQKVKIDENDKLQQYPEISLIRGKYDQSFYDQLQESSRQILAPFSQRATFNLIKHKSMNDDSKYLEDDFKLIKFQQDISYEQHNYQQQFSKNKTVLDKLQEQESFSKPNNNQAEKIDAQAVNSAGSIARRSKNHHYELLKIKSRSQDKPFQISLILLLDILIISSIICFTIINLVIINFQRSDGNQKLFQIQSPYVFNSYYCELTSHDIIYKLANIQGIQFTENLLDKIHSLFSTQNYLQNLSLYEYTFLSIEEANKQLMNNITIHYIDQNDYQNQSFIFYQGQLYNYFRILIKFYQDYNVHNFNDYFFKQSQFEILNLEDSTNLFRYIIRSIIDQFYDSLEYNDSFIINLFIIQTIVQAFFFIIQFALMLDLLKLYRKIINLNCRLYEKDVFIAIQRLQSAREILMDKYSLNWKKADYVHLIYQPFNQAIQTIQNNNKQNKTTLLSSRIQQQTFNIITTAAFLFVLMFLILIINVGGFLFNSQKQNQLKPSYQLAAEFHHFTLLLDSLISNSIRIKSQNVLLSHNYLTDMISTQTLQESIQYFNKDKYQNLTLYNHLVNQFQQSQIQMIKNLINDPNIDPNKADILNNLFFQDICSLVCPNSTDVKDNCTLLYNKGIIGIYTKIINYLKSSYSYELENQKIDPDLQSSIILLNSADFSQIFGRYFTNSKMAFELFANQILLLTTEKIEENFQLTLIYYSITGCFAFIVVGFALIYYLKVQMRQVHLIRLSLTIIPIELIDQQAINILRQL